MRIGEWNIDGVKLYRMTHLAPIGGNHVGRRRQASRAAKLRQYFTAGVAFLRATGVLGISQDIALSAAQPHRFFQRPRTIGIDGDAGVRKSLGKRAHRCHLLLAFEHPALQLEILKPVTIVCRLGEPNDSRRSERLLIAQAKPVIVCI